MNMEVFGVFFTGLLLIGAGSGFQWSDKLSVDANPIQVCSGESIKLLWNYTLEKEERVTSMVWGRDLVGKETGALATFKNGHFEPSTHFSGRLTHLQDAGIELSRATFRDSGMYSVTITVADADNKFHPYQKTDRVIVLDPPKTETGKFHVTREAEAVRTVTSGAWHVQLSCGNFSDVGHPNVHVTWTTPTGDRMKSSSYRDGVFFLLVPNPLVGGNYTCSIPPSLPASTCLAENSRLLDTAYVYVEETAGRFTLMEARQTELYDLLGGARSRNSSLWDMLDQESTQMDLLGEGQVRDRNRIENLEQWRDDFPRNTEPIKFHAGLTDDIRTPSSNANLTLDKVFSNQGGGYKSSTGYFTAPSNGTYVLLATFVYRSNYVSYIHLMKEGKSVFKIRADSTKSTESLQAPVYLTAGQSVWIKISTFTDGRQVDLLIGTSFAGFLM